MTHAEPSVVRTVSPATVVVQGGRPPRRPGGPVNPDITLSSTYHAGGAVDYARTSNPTWEALEQVLGELEGGRALVFASGMGAVNAALELVPAGGVVLAPTHLYNGVSERLGELVGAGRLVHHEVAIDDAAALAAAITRWRPAMLWLESPTNPAMEVCDVAAAAAAAHEVGALVVCDSRSRRHWCRTPSRSAATSRCTAPPSTWPGTPTSCSARW